MLSQNHLTLNVLNFSFVSEKLGCYITTKAIEGAVKLSQKDTKFLCSVWRYQPATRVIGELQWHPFRTEKSTHKR